MSQAAPTFKALLCALGALGAALAAGRAASAADRPNVQPGNYETTVSTEMTGMPAGMKGMPPITVTTCVKADQIKDSQSLAENMQTRSKGKCKISDVKVEHDKLSYSFACEGGTSGTSEVVFSGTTYEGTTKLIPPNRGNSQMTITQHFKSKRIGDC